jgi:hypothetical protein
MRSLQTDPAKPGKRLLLAGLAAFAVMLATSLTLLAIGRAHAPTSLEVLLLTPVFLGVPPIVAAPGLFIHGIVAGVPGASIMYAFWIAKRNWRGIAGVILFASALASAAFAAVA